MTAQLQAGDDLIQGAVSAAGHDNVGFPGMIPGKLHGVTALFRNEDRAEIAGTVEDGNHFRQKTPGLAGTGVGVDDQE